MLGVVPGRIKAVEHDALIADDAGGAVNRMRIHTPRIHALLRAGNEEGSGLMHRVQPHEVQISTIHDVETARLHEKNVEDVNIVQLTVADVNEGGNCAAQIQQGM